MFHVDAVQGFGKFRIYPKKMQIDMLSVSAHKIHGPKGVGFLYLREGARVNPIMYGGGQQKGMRSGTENVAGSAGMAKAAELVYRDLDSDMERMYGLREMLINGVSQIEEVKVNGQLGKRRSRTYCESVRAGSPRRGAFACTGGAGDLCISRKCLCIS